MYMHSPAVAHTLWIFERLYREAPPLLPGEIKTDMAHALEQMRSNFDLSLEELENTVIVFGKKVWPYRRAFEEFLDLYEAKLGERMLIAKLPRALKARYREFVAHGGSLRDLHGGHPAQFFAASERMALCELLIGMNEDVRQHTAQAVASIDRERYEKRVV
mgnify:CR=1 FL=1